MAQRLYKSGSGGLKVPMGAKYIGKLEKILARKGNGSNWPNEDFQHSFGAGNELYRMQSVSKIAPRDSVKIYDKLQKAILSNGTITFTSGKVYGLKNGNILLVGDKGRFLVVSPKPLWDIFKYPNS